MIMPEDLVWDSNKVLEHSIKLNSLYVEQEGNKARLTAHDSILEGHRHKIQQLETSSVMHKREVDEILKSMKSLKNAMWTLVVVGLGGVIGFVFEVIGRMIP